jgi:hypothetical protein
VAAGDVLPPAAELSGRVRVLSSGRARCPRAPAPGVRRPRDGPPASSAPPCSAPRRGRRRPAACADLAAGGETESARSGDAGAIAAGLGDAGERLDAPARAAYRQRLQDLEAELAEATEWADTGRAEKLRGEIEFLRGELSATYGLGGRARKAADTSDRARKAVTSRIRETIERIGKEHPALARHLENAIHTGTFCSYRPDRPLSWKR